MRRNRASEPERPHVVIHDEGHVLLPVGFVYRDWTANRAIGPWHPVSPVSNCQSIAPVLALKTWNLPSGSLWSINPPAVAVAPLPAHCAMVRCCHAILFVRVSMAASTPYCPRLAHGWA